MPGSDGGGECGGKEGANLEFRSVFLAPVRIVCSLEFYVVQLERASLGRVAPTQLTVVVV